MSPEQAWSSGRKHLGELDESVRGRLLALDEPVSRGDWADVVGRSRSLRLGGPPLWVAGSATALVASLAVAAVVLVGALAPTSTSKNAVVPSRLALQLSNGRQIVLYSRAERALYVDEADNRSRGGVATGAAGPPAHVSAATWRTLTRTGPFRIDLTSLQATRPSDGPLPGDRALFSFDLYTTAGDEHDAGSGVLSCQYMAGRDAVCDGSFALTDGSRLTASGDLDPAASSLSLSATRVDDVPSAS